MSETKTAAILLGSPRAGGNSEQLAEAFAKGAREKGYEVRIVRLAGKKLNGCLDCRRCWSAGEPCIQRDDMGQVYEAIQGAEVIVFATPLYFYTWSAQMKPAWDRMLPFFSDKAPEKWLAGKRAVLLSAAGDATADAFEALVKTFELACGYAKWPVAGMVCAPNMYPKTDMAEKGQAFLEEAYRLGRSL